MRMRPVGYEIQFTPSTGKKKKNREPLQFFMLGAPITGFNHEKESSMTFQEMHPKDFLMLQWLRDKKPSMTNAEKALFELLLTQQFLNDYQSYELTKMYDRIREELSAPIEIPRGVYAIEVHESCGMVG